MPTVKPVFALIWDEAAEGNPEKLRRAIYSTKAEAIAQAEHDLRCGRCQGSGKEDSDWGPQVCRSCQGSGAEASKRIVCVEKLDHVDRRTMNRGTVVWEAMVEGE